MGPIIAQLSRMGLTNIGFELITDIRTFNRNAPREMSAEAFALAWVDEHPTFRLRDLAKHFESDGRAGSSANYAVKKMVDAGKLNALGGGNYQRADVAAIEAPKSEKNAAPKKFATRGEDEILKFARQHGGKFNTGQIVGLFEKHGRARNSVYASTNALLNEKMIKRIGASGSGEYTLLAKAKPKAKRPAAPNVSDPAKLNGASHAEEVTNA
jgi:hypothetical protein